MLTDKYQMNLGLLSLNDLSELISRMGYDEKPIFDILKKTKKKGGDREIIYLFKQFTNIDIDVIRNGTYVLKNN